MRHISRTINRISKSVDKVADGWQDYELIDTGYGERLERWGEVLLRRPDPSIIWPAFLSQASWDKADARFVREHSDSLNAWQILREVPERWTIGYGKLRFHIQLSQSKQVGLFPEQAVNWDWMMRTIANADRPISILNVFAYTGAATLACAHAGATVCHVDASRRINRWAMENMALSGMEEHPARFIAEDAAKFIEREIRRGHRYDGIVMDPPSYGHGVDGQMWHLEDHLYELIKSAANLLSENPLFLHVNTYSTGLSDATLYNVLKLALPEKTGGYLVADTIGLPVSASKICIPCGVFARWQSFKPREGKVHVFGTTGCIES